MTIFHAGISSLLFLASDVFAGTTDVWPAFKRNICKDPSKDLFVDFEEGIDGIQVASTYPEIRFSNTGGLDWLYLDVRSNNYNANGYLEDSYAVNGNKASWLGVSGNTGRIDFTGSLASYLSLVSSCGSSGIVVRAYNGDGDLLDSATAVDNTWIDKEKPRPPVARLTVEDTTQGGNISYVEVTGSGNYWLVDDICTDAVSPCMPLDGFVKGPSAKRLDIVFLKDKGYTGSEAAFKSAVKKMINDRLFEHDPIKSKKSSFNFYISEKLEGESNSGGPTCGVTTLPNNFYSLCPFADAVGVLHSETYGDCSSSSVFSSEADTVQSFIHECGHAAFGLFDMYDDAPACNTRRARESYNVYINKTECESDATANGADPSKCFSFTSCPAGAGENWKIQENKNFTMDDGTHHLNGWSLSSTWRIKELFRNLALGQSNKVGANNIMAQKTSSIRGASNDGDVGSRTKSILIELLITETAILLQGTPRVVISASPQYLLFPYDYTVDILSAESKDLGEYGFDDPRIISSESDYSGPATNGATADKTLIVPYFSTVGSAVISDSNGGASSLTVDLSFLSGAPAGTLQADAGGPYEGEVGGNPLTFDASASVASTSVIEKYEWDIGGTGVADIASSEAKVEYNPTTGLDTNLVLTVFTEDGATSQDQTLLTIAGGENEADTDECGPCDRLLKILDGQTMKRSRRIGGACRDKCVLKFLVNLYKRFGWECGEC